MDAFVSLIRRSSDKLKLFIRSSNPLVIISVELPGLKPSLLQMNQDELDELFGEEIEDSSMEISNLTPENDKIEQEEDEESSIESQEIQDTQKTQETHETQVAEINLPAVQKLSNQGFIVIYS